MNTRPSHLLDPDLFDVAALTRGELAPSHEIPLLR